MKNKWGHLAAVAAVSALGLSAVGSGLATTSEKAAGSYAISARMTAKQVVRPRPAGNLVNAQGLLKGTATIGKYSQVAWKLTYSGMTGRVVSALVRYRNAKGVSTAISLCAPCKSGRTSFTYFPSRAQAEQFAKQVRAGKADVVLTTKRNPKGEVRGVLRAHAT